MKVFLTGGTGFVGREILAALHRAGYVARLLVRDPDLDKARELAARYGAELRAGNVLDSNSLIRALDGMNAVIHLVGIISEMGENTFENVHALGTENVIGAARDAQVERFVHMSALGTRADAASRYHQSKWAAEEALRHSDLDYTIHRPSLIFGPGDQFVNVFARLMRFSPVVPLMAAENARFQPVDVGTVASAFVRSVAEPRSIGQTFDLCGPEALTLAEMVEAISVVTRRERLKIRVPLSLARWQASIFEKVYPRLFKKAPPLNRDQLIMLQENIRGNPQPANALFGLKPIGFREGIAQYLGRRRA